MNEGLNAVTVAVFMSNFGFAAVIFLLHADVTPPWRALVASRRMDWLAVPVAWRMEEA